MKHAARHEPAATQPVRCATEQQRTMPQTKAGRKKFRGRAGAAATRLSRPARDVVTSLQRTRGIAAQIN
jgi:hypothetical protein